MTDGSSTTAPAGKAPISLDELELLKTTVLFGDDDVKFLRLSADVLRDQTDAVLDVWYGFVGAHPHLLQYFSNPADGKPDARYLAAVRARLSGFSPM